MKNQNLKPYFVLEKVLMEVGVQEEETVNLLHWLMQLELLLSLANAKNYLLLQLVMLLQML